MTCRRSKRSALARGKLRFDPVFLGLLRLGVLPDRGTLLDLGGGPGTYALEFLARHPRLQATLCDRAPALEVGRAIARSVRHGTRLSYLPLDFMKKPVPGRYDVIWFSNVLHIYGPAENQRLFRRLSGRARGWT